MIMSKWDHASVVWYARTLVLDCGTICMLQEEIRRTDFVSARLSSTCLLSNLGEDDPEEGRLDRIFQREPSKVRSTRKKSSARVLKEQRSIEDNDSAIKTRSFPDSCKAVLVNTCQRDLLTDLSSDHGRWHSVPVAGISTERRQGMWSCNQQWRGLENYAIVLRSMSTRVDQ